MTDVLDQIEYALASDSDARRDEALDSAYVEIDKLRSAISALHRVWFKGCDVDKDAVTVACLTLFATVSQLKTSVSTPRDSQ